MLIAEFLVLFIFLLWSFPRRMYLSTPSLSNIAYWNGVQNFWTFVFAMLLFEKFRLFFRVSIFFTAPIIFTIILKGNPSPSFINEVPPFNKNFQILKPSGVAFLTTWLFSRLVSILEVSKKLFSSWGSNSFSQVFFLLCR